MKYLIITAIFFHLCSSERTSGSEEEQRVVVQNLIQEIERTCRKERSPVTISNHSKSISIIGANGACVNIDTPEGMEFKYSKESIRLVDFSVPTAIGILNSIENKNLSFLVRVRPWQVPAELFINNEISVLSTSDLNIFTLHLIVPLELADDPTKVESYFSVNHTDKQGSQNVEFNIHIKSMSDTKDSDFKDALVDLSVHKKEVGNDPVKLNGFGYSKELHP